MVPLEQMRQVDAERVFENGGDDDAVEKRQNRSHNPDRHDDADHQEDADSGDGDGVSFGHRATMPPFAQGRQGRLRRGLGALRA